MDTRLPHPGNAVLVVEDEFMIRQFMVDTLEENGFEVAAARDADEALAILEKHPETDVLFTDVNMPGHLNGLELAREVARRWPHIERIVTSGRVLPPAGSADYAFIPKPYSPCEVAERIREVLAERGQGVPPPLRRHARHH